MIALAAALVVFLAACGGSGSKSSSKEVPTVPRQPGVSGCTILSSQDVARLTSAGTVTPRDFARTPGRECGSLFIGAGGVLVVSVSELTGGRATLARLRATKAAELGAGAVRPVPKFGPGAFIAARRYVAFRKGSRALVLETGYGAGSSLVLTVRELTALAQLAKSRL